VDDEVVETATMRSYVTWPPIFNLALMPIVDKGSRSTAEVDTLQLHIELLDERKWCC
jgi:hypothetical protein